MWSTTNNSRLALWAAVPVLLTASGSAPLERFEAVEPHMGTLFRIEIYAPDSATAQAVFHAAFARVAALDEILSDYQPESELSRITSTAVGHPVRISEDLFAVLSKGQAVAHASDGAFDITVGPLTHLWRAARKAQRLPDTDSIRAAAARCGFQKMHLDEVARTVVFDQPGMQLDAGGIAKGYAADQALLMLTEHGIQSALVAASGDLAFSNAPPGKPGWQIGIEGRVLSLSNGAVSTSGDSEQRLDHDGQRYSHIIDPRTGAALTRSLLVTVTGRRGIDTDPASTAVSVLGAAAGMHFIHTQPNLQAYITATDQTQ